MRNKVGLFAMLAIVVVGCSGEVSPAAPSPETDQATVSESPDATNIESATSSDAAPNNSPGESVPAESGAMTLYRESQALMKDGKLEEGYQTAKKALQQFTTEAVDVPWMMLESVTVGGKRVDVHFNMGPDERQMPDDGIVRPLSFRIWSAGDDGELLQVIDFELGRSNGESITAAIGEMTESGHANYGILEVDASYAAIRQRVLDLVAR